MSRQDAIDNLKSALKWLVNAYKVTEDEQIFMAEQRIKAALSYLHKSQKTT